MPYENLDDEPYPGPNQVNLADDLTNFVRSLKGTIIVSSTTFSALAVAVREAYEKQYGYIIKVYSEYTEYTLPKEPRLTYKKFPTLPPKPDNKGPRPRQTFGRDGKRKY